MLLDNFYKYDITNHSDNTIEAVITLNKNHQIFEGHFPEYPIVPGVTQVLMIKEILSSCLSTNLQLSSSKSIKFLAMINPNETTTLQLNISYQKDNDNIYKVNAHLFADDINFLKLKGQYSERK